GIYLGRALALGLVLAFFLPPSWRAWKLAAAALSVVIGLGTLFSFARGAWLGVLAALIFVGLLTRSRPLLLALGAALLAALAFLFWQSIQLWRRHRDTQLGALALALLASMIDFAVHGLVDMAYFTMDLALTFWLTMGLLVVLKRLQHPAGRG